MNISVANIFANPMIGLPQVTTIHATYVTGFWKTDQIVTLGLFHFIGPANGYTCTLHIHSALTRLG